jgi:hypothetical protein
MIDDGGGGEEEQQGEALPGEPGPTLPNQIIKCLDTISPRPSFHDPNEAGLRIRI